MQITQDQYMNLVQALAKIRNNIDAEFARDIENDRQLYDALKEAWEIAVKALDDDMKALNEAA
jgi:hypothetical protein